MWSCWVQVEVKIRLPRLSRSFVHRIHLIHLVGYTIRPPRSDRVAMLTCSALSNMRTPCLLLPKFCHRFVHAKERAPGLWAHATRLIRFVDRPDRRWCKVPGAPPRRTSFLTTEKCRAFFSLPTTGVARHGVCWCRESGIVLMCEVETTAIGISCWQGQWLGRAYRLYSAGNHRLGCRTSSLCLAGFGSMADNPLVCGTLGTGKGWLSSERPSGEAKSAGNMCAC
jgi:hypothetical protein